MTRFRQFSVRVARITPLTPSFVRVTFTGEDLASFSAIGLDQRIKLVLPIPGHGFTDLPDGPGLWEAWRNLPDAIRNPIRTYTIRSFRPDQRELDVDFVDHGDLGPASRWVARATMGDELRIVGAALPESPEDLPSGAAEFDPSRRGRLLIAGDETAAPAICAILEALDVTAIGHVVIEVPTDADRLPVSAPTGVEVRWVARNGRTHGSAMTEHVRSWAAMLRSPASTAAAGAGAAGAGAAVATELPDVDIDHDILWDVPSDASPSDVYAWIAGEAGCVKELRRDLVRGLGIDRRSVAFMGYWRHGRPEN